MMTMMLTMLARFIQASMILDPLMNAAYRVSLHGPGVELEGGVHPLPARRWLKETAHLPSM